ncbi:MAG: argininosuccinate lyase, partial [Planctomycetes bacterium]|nr:argininosuccinate lyase [Planctomycetota bacterium]
MAKLWTKNDEFLDDPVAEFCFARDVELDVSLLPYDVLGSLAHSRMLESIGILTGPERQAIHSKLLELAASFGAGAWRIEISDEDVHTALESRLGEAGSKLHTARSRNDQVLTDLRLLSKDRLLEVATEAVRLAGKLLASAKRNEFMPMPGYTHLQRAMPSSWGMWLGAFAEALADVLRELKLAHELMDQCPLGSGAGYGVSLPVDRELTAHLLGFSRVQRNSVYCQNSRGHFESVALSALASLMAVIGRLAADACLFCSQEFAFLKLPGKYFT